MPLDDEEIRKRIKKYEESLPESERNPNAEQDVKELIERASKPLPKGTETPDTDERYSEKRTRLRKTEDTSD